MGLDEVDLRGLARAADHKVERCISRWITQFEEVDGPSDLLSALRGFEARAHSGAEGYTRRALAKLLAGDHPQAATAIVSRSSARRTLTGDVARAAYRALDEARGGNLLRRGEGL